MDVHAGTENKQVELRKEGRITLSVATQIHDGLKWQAMWKPVPANICPHLLLNKSETSGYQNTLPGQGPVQPAVGDPASAGGLD